MSIHPSAIVDPKAELDRDVEVGPHCVIGPGVRAGPGTRFHAGVIVAGRVIIGRNNIFHPFSVIGGDPQDLKYHGEDTRVEIGDNNTIREYVTVNKGTAFGGGVTALGSSNLIMAYVHIAHDCIVKDNIIMGNATTMGGHVTVESWVRLSGLVGIHHFVTVGEHAFVGGASKVVTDLPPYMMADGHPLKVRNINQVGLERAGFSKETVARVRRIYRLIYKEKTNFATLAAGIREGHELYCPEVMNIIRFMERTEKGVYGRAKEAERSDR
ncbi:MAG: acyl-ACP--UDP-N-acetylglucosamine O-acyltransferase [Planctomycetota bacterium]